MRQHIEGFGAIYGRPNSPVLWIEFWHNNKRHRISSGETLLSKARKVLMAKKGEARYQGFKYAGRAEERVTFQDLVDCLITEYRKRDRVTLGSLIKLDGGDGYLLKHLRAAFGNLHACEISGARISKYQVDRRAAGAANQTINHEVNRLKTMYRLAVRDELLYRGSVPAFPDKLKRGKPRTGITDWATWRAAANLMPEDLRDPLRWIFRCGWRLGAVRKLEWKSVDRRNGMALIEVGNSKDNKKTVRFPFGEDPEASAIIERAHARRRMDCRYVFHREGRQLLPSMFRKRWVAARKAIGIPTLLIHDSRRCTVTELLAAGASPQEAMEISGHRTTAMIDWYDIRADESVRRSVRRRVEYEAEQSRQRLKVTPITVAPGQLSLLEEAQSCDGNVAVPRGTSVAVLSRGGR